MLPSGPLGTGGGSGSGDPALGGDLSGTASAATVDKLQTIAVSLAAPAPVSGRPLTYRDYGGGVIAVVVDQIDAAGISDGAVGGAQLDAAVAGAGLTGGGGSALAVGAGTGITVNANDVALSAGAALANIGSGNIANQYLATGAVTGLKIAASAFTAFPLTGRNGAGACTLTGAAVGDVVMLITGSAAAYANASFESTITVVDQIQQSSGSDLSANTYAVLVLRKNA